MGESESMIETLSKTRIVGYFLALMGVALFFMPLAYLTSYIYTGSSEPLAAIAFYIIADIAEIAAAITLWIISTKILQAKS
jgi:uncharacterized membrane protein